MRLPAKGLIHSDLYFCLNLPLQFFEAAGHKLTKVSQRHMGCRVSGKLPHHIMEASPKHVPQVGHCASKNVVLGAV